MRTIYQFPTPPTTPIVIGVISLGGGLYGTMNGNILTGGDVQSYWTSLGITAQPTVAVVLVDGATMDVTDFNSTIENSIDVETIGACCPGSNVTIIFYLAPNTFPGFYNAFSYAINTLVSVNGVSVKPSVISCSWGAPEIGWGNSVMNQYNSLFQQAFNNNVMICAASGDNGASDGQVGKNVDFPASSPNVVSCGGTNLVCPNLVYDSQTVETGWTNGGGGFSSLFARPSYQSGVSSNAKRSVPDICLNADPATGVQYLIGGQTYIIGGTSIVSPAVSAFIAATGATGNFLSKLYTLQRSAFHDILVGNNGGYDAKTGFDQITGLGSISGTQMVSQLKNTTPGPVPIVRVTSVRLAASPFIVLIGRTYQLVAIITPSNATNKSVLWSSSNSSAMTVSTNGLIKRLRSGRVTITVTTMDGKYKASTIIN
jgi:kumamolisin